MTDTSLSSLATATRGELIGGQHAAVCCGRVVIDSRLIKPGDLFWALRGEHHDGHDFLAEARQRGASATVVQFDRLDQAQEVWQRGAEHGPVQPLIVVEDTLPALA